MKKILAISLSILMFCGLASAGDGGNLAGGTLLVAGVYWIAYLRGERMRKGRSS